MRFVWYPIGVIKDDAPANITPSRKPNSFAPSCVAVSTAIGIINTTPAMGVMTLANAPVTTMRRNNTPMSGSTSPVW